MKKIIKKECTVGYKCWYENEPNKVWYEQGSTENGYCFKDEEAFNSKQNAVCYIPENDDYWKELEEDFQATVDETEYGTYGYVYEDILNACDGVEPLAEILFWDVTWQYPETLLYEWYDADLVEKFADVSGDNDIAFLASLADIYDEEEYGTDWHNYYDFYMKHKKH